MNSTFAAFVRRGMVGLALGAALVAIDSSQSFAAGVTMDYVDCSWAPYAEGWACALPASFTEGRFAGPPDFKHDALSEQLRQRAWQTAKTSRGARARGRLGVFVPADGAWLFVPGPTWLPGEVVFLPPPKKT
jgi:hypothetical protein